MSQCFHKPFHSHFDDSIKVKIDLSNYATKADIKNISHVDTSSFALKTNLANLKSEVDKLDIDKLVRVPTVGQNVVIFGADMSSSIHIDNKGKDILILGLGPTQG